MPVYRQRVMILFVLLISFLSYSFYLYTTLPVKYNAEKKEEDKGKLVWQENNCNACHQVYGLGGYLGPDLTNVYSQKGQEYIKAYLNIGKGAMPEFHLSTEETNALLAFMKDIDESGKADPKTFTINNDGTIEQ